MDKKPARGGRARATPKSLLPDEHALQCQVVAAVRCGAARGVNGLPEIVSVPNQRSAKLPRGSLNKLVREGMKPGFPDLIVFYRGRALCVELKSPRLDRSALAATAPEQKEVQSDLAMVGVRTITSKNFDETIASIKQFVSEIDCFFKVHKKTGP